MSRELTGRALSEACAKAMMWVNIDHPEHPAHGVDYSTDPETLDEKLAWLANHCAWEIGQIFGEGDIFARGYLDELDDDGEFVEIANKRGDTLHEATARLVVAVAERGATAKEGDHGNG